MTKWFALSVVASAVAVLATNLVIYVLFYGDFLASNSGLSRELFEQVQKPADQTDILAFVAATLLTGTLLTAVIERVKARTFTAGATTAFVFGCLMVGSVDLGLIATTHYYSTFSGIVDIFVAAATFAIGGGIAALILRRGAQAAP